MRFRDRLKCWFSGMATLSPWPVAPRSQVAEGLTKRTEHEALRADWERLMGDMQEALRRETNGS